MRQRRFEGTPVGFVRLRTVLCALLLLTAPAQARDEAFSTTVDFALIEDYDTGAVLFEKNADEPMPPASTAKLLTAEIVFHELKEGRLHLDDIFDVSEKAWREGGAHAHGAAMFLAIHSHVRIEDLLRGLLIQSGNDAAMTLAEGLAGSEDNFAETMNKRAAELGMTHSHFANSRGKVDPNQHVTARDMALLAAHIIRDYPEYYHYFGEKDFTWNKIHQLNRNPLLTMDIGADGLKAGDVADGGFALVGSAVQDNQRLIVVMNGLKSATERSEEARKLFNYGFHSFDRRTLYGAGDQVGSASVYGGESDEVPLVTENPVALFVPRGESDRLVAKIVYTGPLAAPVEAGKDVARLKIWRGDMLVVDAPLRTGASVALGGLTRRAFDAGIELAGDAVRRALKKQ
jgi:D-alanyl-D-alanine carboxypeptidase (penicillin-binding protein 5/6)